MENLEDLRKAADRVKKWRSEDRLVCAAVLVAGDVGILSVVRGEVLDDSEFRICIKGSGHAAFMLIGSRLFTLEEWVKEAIELFSSPWTVDWSDAMAFRFPKGDVIALWASQKSL